MSGILTQRLFYPDGQVSHNTPYNKDARGRFDLGRRLIGGGYLLSHFRSTIGAAGFNFSVRNGKRWNPRAMAALISLKKEHYTGSFLLPVRSACGWRLWRLLSLLVSTGFYDGFHGGRVACAVKVVACAPARLWRCRQAVAAVSVSLFLFLLCLGIAPGKGLGD